MASDYRAAGVDLVAGDEAVQLIKPLVRATYRPEVVGDIGGFGGLFDIGSAGYTDPLLGSATDGGGTKAGIARQRGRVGSIGRRDFDSLAMVHAAVVELASVYVGLTSEFLVPYLEITP